MEFIVAMICFPESFLAFFVCSDGFTSEHGDENLLLKAEVTSESNRKDFTKFIFPSGKYYKSSKNLTKVENFLLIQNAQCILTCSDKKNNKKN